MPPSPVVALGPPPGVGRAVPARREHGAHRRQRDAGRGRSLAGTHDGCGSAVPSDAPCKNPLAIRGRDHPGSTGARNPCQGKAGSSCVTIGRPGPCGGVLASARMGDERRFLTMDDGARIAVTLHTPDHVQAPWPVVFEARPYRKDDISDASAIYRRLCDEGGLAVCRADVRGTGSSDGDALDEYTAREWQDWLRRDRLARRAALEQRQRGHVRHLLQRVQLAADGGAAAAGPEGDHPDLRDRPAVHRRRALRRRGAPRHRLPRLPDEHGGDERPAARALGLRRGLARGVAAPHRGQRALGAPLARGAGRGRLLAARVGVVRRLRAHRGGHDDRGGPRRRLPQHGLPRLRAARAARSGCSSARGAT